MKTEVIELPFNEPDFLQAWETWVQYRKERKLPKYVPTGLKRTLTMLKNMAENNKDAAIKIIEHSMAMNYQGLFPPPKQAEKPKPAIMQNNQQKPPDKVPVNKEPVSDQSMMDWIETLKKEKRVDFMPLMVYDWLVNRGELRYSNIQKKQALQYAAKYRRQQLIDSAAPDLQEYLDMYQKGEFTGRHYDYLVNLAKKVLLMDYLSK